MELLSQLFRFGKMHHFTECDITILSRLWCIFPITHFVIQALTSFFELDDLMRGFLELALSNLMSRPLVPNLFDVFLPLLILELFITPLLNFHSSTFRVLR